MRNKCGSQKKNVKLAFYMDDVKLMFQMMNHITIQTNYLYDKRYV